MVKVHEMNDSSYQWGKKEIFKGSRNRYVYLTQMDGFIDN